jgi:hypothetical protein
MSGGSAMLDDERNENRTEIVNPIAKALSQVVKRQAAKPRDVYRLAVIFAGYIDSKDDPEAMKTIRAELRELINDLSETISDA